MVSTGPTISRYYSALTFVTFPTVMNSWPVYGDGCEQVGHEMDKNGKSLKAVSGP